MRIGTGLEVGGPVDAVVADAQSLAATGAPTLWVSQIFGWDALTLLGVVGRSVPAVELGTAVVPVQPRHPVMLASQALTVHAAIGGRLVLGVGLSHQMVIESVFGQRWQRPASYMEEYLSVLMPVLHGEQVSFSGEQVSASTFGPLDTPEAEAPEVLVAALGPTMLEIAGRLADGTVTWMTGPRTVAEHIVPTIAASAAAAGRRSPRVAVHLPVCVTDDPDGARERAAKIFGIYGSLPSYQAMLAREAVAGPADLAIIGSEEQVASAVTAVADTGATDCSVTIYGNAEERARTRRLVSDLQPG